MKLLRSFEPGKLEEIVVITFFILFFILTAVAESFGQKNNKAIHKTLTRDHRINEQRT
jgi:hypothetical protein